MIKSVLFFVFSIFFLNNVFAQSCVNFNSSTITLNSIISGSPSTCNYTFTPVATISGNAVKLAVVTLTVGSNVYNICYTNNGTSIVGTYNGTTPCGSTNDKLSSGNTTFPSVTFSAQCGATTFQYAGYNGASTGGGTGICVTGSVPITFVPTFSSSGTSLPVKLVSFSAKFNMNKNPELFWEIDDAQNFKEFIVQKSMDAIYFEDVKVVKYSNLITKYQFEDSNISSPQTIYYRLKMNDLNQEFKYSSIISLNASVLDKLYFFPNPNFENKIHFSKSIEKDEIIGLFDILGNSVDYKLNSENTQIEILSSFLGSVFIKYKEKGFINSERIILIK